MEFVLQNSQKVEKLFKNLFLFLKDICLPAVWME